MLEGTLDRVSFRSEETAWSVVRIQVEGRGEVTAVGNLLGVQPGETVRLTGQWVHDRQYGEQFKVASYLTVQPNTVVGIERYLGSGLVAGIGPKIAKKLVGHLGIDTLTVIDQEPERLREVPGIGPKLSQRILQAWDGQRAIRDVMVFLQSHGIATGHATKIFKTYGADAIRVVRERPYALAQDVFGIGFPTADRIARRLGTELDDPARIAAGVLHVLRTAADDGHTYLPRNDTLDATQRLLGVDPSLVTGAIGTLAAANEVVVQSHPNAVTPADATDAIFLTHLDRAEGELAATLCRLASRPSVPVGVDPTRAVAWYEKREAISLAPHQREAIEQALTSRMLVITGGPGTGKTTLIRGVVAILDRAGLRIHLAAPTGRAAKRLGEATGQSARTIHRLLEFQPKTRTFARGPDHPLTCDLLIIDEASMLDTVLASHLARAVPVNGRLILVGDIDQLPSVGPGRVLADVIASGAADVVRLTKIFRQAQQSLIVVNAHRIRQGQAPIPRPPGDDGDFFFFEREQPEAILATVLDLVTTRIPRRFGFDPRTEIQVLSPMQRGLLGAGNLNQELQTRLNPTGLAVERGSRVLRVNDRVMQLRNNYDLDVFNGDIGRIVSINTEAKELMVAMDDRTVGYTFAELDELTLAYAGSIHKSQGSEYPCVVMPLHTQHFVLLQRNLLYTAVTRGRRLVIVVGSRRALRRAVDHADAAQRSTLLAQRLAGQTLA